MRVGCFYVCDRLSWIRIILMGLMHVDDLKQKQNKNSLCGQLSCFESLMVNVSDALTWMGFTTCIRGIYHHVLCSTLPHRAINWIKTSMQGGVCYVIGRIRIWLIGLMLCMWMILNKNRIKTPSGVNSHASSCWCNLSQQFFCERVPDALLRQLPSSVWRQFAHRAINWIKNLYAGRGWAMWLVEYGLYWWDWCSLEVKNKNRVKTPCGHTLILRVSDGECLWCPYVNGIHDVH